MGIYHVVMWFTQTTTQKQTTLLNVFVLFFGRQTHGKGKQKSNNQYYFFLWKAIIIERKWHVKEKTSSLIVIQVQVYRPMVMEPHIDEGSLILWSSSPTLMNTKKKKKKKICMLIILAKTQYWKKKNKKPRFQKL